MRYTSLLARIVCSTLLLTTAVQGHEEGHDGAHDHAPRRVKPAELAKPSPLPDRVVLSMPADPSRGMTVTWRTDVTAAAPRVEFLPAASMRGDLQTAVTGYAGKVKMISGRTEPFESDLGPVQFHSASLTGLEPDTMYAYRVGDGVNHSEWFQFRTAAADDRAFTFVYFGDAQNEIRSLWSRVLREANQHAPRAAFMLHAGDLVNYGDTDAEWAEWFDAGGWLNGMIPVVATPGNHEYVGETPDDENEHLTKQWRPQFSFPENGPPGLEESVYWFDYQGARVISLNSNEQIERQVTWLRTVLLDPARPRWTIVTFHHPVFSAAKDRDNPELRAAWKPTFDELGVDLVLQGHDHTYARSRLGGSADNVADGVTHVAGNAVYVVSVSGPKMYPLQGRWEAARVASGAQLFQVIHVSKDEIAYEARLASGELYDAFRLVKGDEGKNTIVEMIPPTDEIRD